MYETLEEARENAFEGWCEKTFLVDEVERIAQGDPLIESMIHVFNGWVEEASPSGRKANLADLAGYSDEGLRSWFEDIVEGSKSIGY